MCEDHYKICLFSQEITEYRYVYRSIDGRSSS